MDRPEPRDGDAGSPPRTLWSPPDEPPGRPLQADDDTAPMGGPPSAQPAAAAGSPWTTAPYVARPGTERDPTRPLPSAPPEWPAPPPSSATPPRPRGTGRAALVGGLVGALVAAVVSAGVTTALDDDEPATPVERRDVTPVTTSEGALDIQGILAKVQPSVVAIETSATTARGVFEGAGSGIVISEDGHILTNAHVVGALGDIRVVLADGTEHEASLVGSSPEDDMAVIKVDGVDGLVPAELGSSDDLQVGDQVIAIGNALNLGSEPTVTLGIVSATDRDLSAEGVTLEGLIQTDAAINPGNSGGPLVNAAGEVVGMNTAIVADAQNLGFAIAIDRARPIIEQLESGEGTITPDQAFLGVSTTPLDGLNDQVRARFDIDVDEGAFVAEVVPGSAADRAGLELGDVIVEIDGEAVADPTDVRDAIVAHEPGDTVEIRIIRAGEELTLDAELGRRGDTR